MKVKFKATGKIPEWRNRFGFWRDGNIKDIPDDVAQRLIDRFPKFFFEVKEQPEEKEVMPTHDKMIHGADKSKRGIGGSR